MRSVLLLLFFFTFSLTSYAQLEPVKWSFKAEKVSEGEYDIIFTASIDKGWSVYSPLMEAEDGPIPTTFEFYNNDIEAVGKAREAGNRKETFDPNFNMDLVKFSGRAKFTQRVKVDESKKVVGVLTYMTCDDESCLPPEDVSFEIGLHD